MSTEQMSLTPWDVIASGGSVIMGNMSVEGNDDSMWAEVCAHTDRENPTAEDIMLMEIDDANEETADLLGNGDLYDFLQNDDTVAKFKDGTVVQVNRSLNALEINDAAGKTHIAENKRKNLEEFVSDYRIETEHSIGREDLGFLMDSWL